MCKCVCVFVFVSLFSRPFRAVCKYLSFLLKYPRQRSLNFCCGICKTINYRYYYSQCLLNFLILFIFLLLVCFKSSLASKSTYLYIYFLPNFFTVNNNIHIGF